jgi:GNAT superfamily N-acetyltransferase
MDFAGAQPHPTDSKLGQPLPVRMVPLFCLRRATPEDAAAVRDLVHAAYAKWVPVLGRTPQPMEVDYDRAVREHFIDLLLVEERLTALIELVVEPDCVLIENVAVTPDQAGKGYGKALLTHAVDFAHSVNRKRLRLYTHKLMVENIALYQRLGYAIDKQWTTADGRERVDMSRDI